MQQGLKSVSVSFACLLKLFFSVPFSMIIKQSGLTSLPVQLSINSSDALETLILS